MLMTRAAPTLVAREAVVKTRGWLRGGTNALASDVPTSVAIMIAGTMSLTGRSTVDASQLHERRIDPIAGATPRT